MDLIDAIVQLSSRIPWERYLFRVDLDKRIQETQRLQGQIATVEPRAVASTAAAMVPRATIVKAPAASPTIETARAPSAPPKGRACSPCTSDHLSTCSGALSEALRFARGEGMESSEVQSRLALCVDELNAWERIDASPEKITASSPAEKEFMAKWLPRGRELRHMVNDVRVMEELEAAAAQAKIWSQEARQDMQKLSPPVMRHIQEVASKLKAGEITKEEAFKELKEKLASKK